ncbi:cysteine--tRNA ligase [Periweissella ghanensis]|uniref:Cysteine--tRNA ligase n=1 Tax=Periweissella ghanensis TaxID=467997 RepID=A0ABM8ZCF8_9LACO|nr:cysteine--tRNA ligase [Periweissella ghanensis]MCM0600040.1 cysteine--tRNA ligase [Periweissella ghanensis]CAH0418991.1 Cysteine--tRNA ligase [Periweissella ghanensis]
MIHVFNTMTRTKELFKTIQPGIVNMYVCGPTVYNYIHIGNARSAIAFDTIRRYFEYSDYQVNYVSNFTDVDDKIIKAAHEAGITEQALTTKFEQAFNDDTAPLNIKPATVRPLATEHISEIITFVDDLIAKGYAYEADGDVYFRARKFPDYGHLAHQNIDDLEVGASERLDDGELARKEDPVDFAVWKGADPEVAITWDSPWGPGRPGWHIECSVMAIKYLGNTIDIHGGGQDLAFPHHTNEIAQSEAHTGKTFANYWLHNGFVTVGDDNEKMSKSLGNFVTVHDLLQTVNPQALRLMMATTHYRRPLAYTQTAITEATQIVKRLQTAYTNVAFRLKQADTMTTIDEAIDTQVAQFKSAFMQAMDDDFNVANAMTVINDFATALNVYAKADHVSAVSGEQALAEFADQVMVIGVDVKPSGRATDDNSWIEAQVAARDAAKKAKDYAQADAIRAELKAQGIVLEDTAQGTRWKKE